MVDGHMLDLFLQKSGSNKVHFFLVLDYNDQTPAAKWYWCKHHTLCTILFAMVRSRFFFKSFAHMHMCITAYVDF